MNLQVIPIVTINEREVGETNKLWNYKDTYHY